MNVVQNVETAALAAREKAGYGVRWPMAAATVITDLSVLDIVKASINVRELYVVADHDGISKFEPDYKAIGRRFGKNTQDVAKLVPTLTKVPCETDGLIEEHHVVRKVVCDGCYATFDGGIVLLDVTRTPELILKGTHAKLRGVSSPRVKRWGSRKS